MRVHGLADWLPAHALLAASSYTAGCQLMHCWLPAHAHGLRHKPALLSVNPGAHAAHCLPPDRAWQVVQLGTAQGGSMQPLPPGESTSCGRHALHVLPPGWHSRQFLMLHLAHCPFGARKTDA